MCWIYGACCSIPLRALNLGVQSPSSMWRNERPVTFASWTATPPVLLSSYSDTVGFTSMSVQFSGMADYNYGTASVTSIASESCYTPGLASLQVWPSILDLKGRQLAFVRNPADASPGLLARYNVDDHWDESTGPVVNVANLPDQARIIKEIVGAMSGGSQTYFSAEVTTQPRRFACVSPDTVRWVQQRLRQHGAP